MASDAVLTAMMINVNGTPIPFKFGPIPVKVVPTGHGTFDWTLFALAAIAALGALLAVWLWIVQLRKTPEVRFDWWIDGVKAWGPDDPIIVELGRPLRVHFIFSNVGTGAADGAIINIVAPSFMRIAATDKVTGKDVSNSAATDNVVNNPPDHHVTWIATRISEFYPSLPVIHTVGFEINDTGKIHHERDHVYYVAASVEAVGLPASGQRFIPSWAHRVPGERSWPHWGVEDHWAQEAFPGKKYRRSFRRVRALPKKHVRAGPGRRQDRRPFSVNWPPEQPPATAESDQDGDTEAG